jgi:hypothetical protein
VVITVTGRTYVDITFTFGTGTTTAGESRGTLTNYVSSYKESSSGTWETPVTTSDDNPEIFQDSLTIGTSYDIKFWGLNEITTALGVGVFNFTYVFTHVYVPQWADAVTSNAQGTGNEWCFDWT